MKGSDYVAEKGWIKLHRQLQDCPLWYCERFSKGQAWVDLLLMTNHADKKIIFNGQTMVVKRGQYLTSMLKLAEKWQWDRKTVKSFLSLLVKDNMISIETDNHRTLITIENYSVFQMSDNEELDSTLDNDTDTKITNGTDNALDTRTDTNKNIKNVKNDKNINSLVSNDTNCRTSEVRRVVEEWNKLSVYGIKKVSKVSSGSKRYSILNGRLNEYGIDDVLKAIDNIKHSDFLQGKHSGRPWQITFDWFILPSNFPKVLEGNYDKNNNNSNNNDFDLERWLKNE